VTVVADGRQTPAAGLAYRLDDVGVTFPGKESARWAIQGVRLEIAAGETVGIVGRSGVGKTTLLRVLGGMLPASAGAVRLFGHPVCGPPADVVMVFQDYVNALLPWRTVRRNVALGIERRLGRSELRQRVDQALRMVGLEDRDGDYPAQLSGGMAQRVQIARALTMRPRVLLMDEPFGALDALTRAELQDVLLRVQEQTVATMVFVTHDLDEAIYLADRVLVLGGEPGRITLEQSTRLCRPRDQIRTRGSTQYLRVRQRLGELLSGGQR
jgi:NitT/TauT family transport system ATP-binding protein